MKIKNLIEQRTKLIADARALLEKDGFNNEAEAKFKAMMIDADKLKEQIDSLQKLEGHEKELKDPAEKPGYSFTATGGPSDIRASREYADAFWNVVRYDKPFTQYKNVLQIGAPLTQGGYLVPKEFERAIVTALEEQNFMRRISDIMTTSNNIEIPIETDYGTATWTAENVAATESDSAFNQIVLAAHKLARLTKVSDELMQDSAFDMGAYLAGAFGRSFGAAEEAAMINGTGTGQPTGVTSTTNVFNLAGAAAITSDEVLGVFHALTQPYRMNAVWIMKDATLLACRKLKDTSGAYYFVPSMTAGMPDTFLGRPVYTSQYMPAMATGAKSILFGNFKYYRIADRQTRTLQRLNELYAANGQVGFIGRQRVDGKLLLNAAVVAAVQA